MKKLSLLLKISRTRFWMYILGPYILGYAYSGIVVPPWLFFYGLFYFLFPANLFLYGVNDIYDQETDKKNPKKDDYEIRMQKESIEFYKRSIIVSFLFALPLFVFSNWLAFWSLALFFFFSLFYSAPPIRFKEIPFLDSLSNILYIFPGIFCYSLLTGEYPSWDIILACALWSSAMHIFSAIPDIEVDKKAGINTTAVFIGYKKSLLLCSFYWLVSTFLIIHYHPFFIITFIYPIIPIFVLRKKVDVMSVYKKFPFLNAFIGFILYWFGQITHLLLND